MQPQFIKVPNSPDTSFLIRDMKVPYFYNPFHFHPELELTFIIHGTGTRFIGDNIDYFCQGDLVLVGPNLPHLWKNDKVYYEDEGLNSHAIVIQFKEDFLRNEFGELPEMAQIKSLLASSEQGLKIFGQTQHKIAKRMLAMLKQSPIERIASLLMILSTIAASREYELLSSPGFAKAYNNSKADMERINRVYAYVIENFSEDINLNDIARVANLSPTAFCRYFKSCTNKTFSAFLLETRLNYACKLLVNDARNITQVSFEAGFNNLSYFNRQFKKFTGISPLQYKRKFLKTEAA